VTLGGVAGVSELEPGLALETAPALDGCAVAAVAPGDALGPPLPPGAEVAALVQAPSSAAIVNTVVIERIDRPESPITASPRPGRTTAPQHRIEPEWSGQALPANAIVCGRCTRWRPAAGRRCDIYRRFHVADVEPGACCGWYGPRYRPQRLEIAAARLRPCPPSKRHPPRCRQKRGPDRKPGPLDATWLEATQRLGCRPNRPSRWSER
jgi:hypothetical protein